jgi:glucokinase
LNLSRWSAQINTVIIGRMILAGDIGGTNSRLAIFDEQLNLVSEKAYLNEGRGGLKEIVIEFRSMFDHPVDRACFAAAGAVTDGRVTMNNLNWSLDEKQLAADLGIPRVTIINDLRGHAEGIEVLPPDKFITVYEGRPMRTGGRAIIAAGTGLGEAGLAFDSRTGRYLSFPTEGGASDFSPTNEEEDGLLQFLRKRNKRVFWELVLSGRGLRNLYDFYCQSGRFESKDFLPSDPTPADISAAGLAGTSAVAVAALDLFARLYGAEAGNLAVKTLATGGLYLGGGIAGKIAAKLKQPPFLKAFQSKGTDKMEAVMKLIPIKIVNFDLSGLYGAGNYARHT